MIATDSQELELDLLIEIWQGVWPLIVLIAMWLALGFTILLLRSI